MPPSAGISLGVDMSNAPDVYAESGMGSTLSGSVTGSGITGTSEANTFYSDDGNYQGTAALLGVGVGPTYSASKTEGTTTVAGVNLDKVIPAAVQLFDNLVYTVGEALSGDIDSVDDLVDNLTYAVDNPFGLSNGTNSYGDAK